AVNAIATRNPARSRQQKRTRLFIASPPSRTPRASRTLREPFSKTNATTVRTNETAKCVGTPRSNRAIRRRRQPRDVRQECRCDRLKRHSCLKPGEQTFG